MTTYVRDLASKLSADYNSPQDLAAAVLDNLGTDVDVLHAALQETLPQYLSAYITRRRNDTMNNRNRPAPDSSKSAKGDGIRSWFAKFLAQTQPTEAGVWKQMGDCNADDMMFAANDRRTRADAHMARADQYERLATAIKEAGVSTVRELEEPAVRAALDGHGAA